MSRLITIPRTFALALTAFAIATPIRAQSITSDVRWQPWLGCWQATDATVPRAVGGSKTATVCVTPSAGTSAVDIATVIDGKAVEHTHIEANGQQRTNSKDGCTGWESAKWSATGTRVYLASEYACPGGTKRTSTGLMSMSPEGQWLDVLSVGSGQAAGVRVIRMRETRDGYNLPDDVAAAVRTSALSRNAAMIMASTDLLASDILDVTKNTNPAVVEAWLVERGQTLDVNAKTLVAFADAGLPDRVLDVIVALSYPKLFALNPATGAVSGVQVSGAWGGDAGRARSSGGYDPFGYPSYGYDSYDDCLSPYGRPSAYYSDCGRYGYSRFGYNSGGYGYNGYGYGWYPGSQPVIVIVRPSGGADGANTTEDHPRVVNGKGYTQGGSSTPSPSTSSSSGKASSTSPATSTTSPSSEPTITRTAKPRPPGN